MEVMGLQVFVSALLVLGSLVLFGVSVKQRDVDHADRLSLLPLEDERDAAPRLPSDAAAPPATAAQGEHDREA